MHSCTLPILRCTSKRLKPVEVWSPWYVFPFALIFSKRHRCKYNSEKLYCYHQDSNPSSLVYVTSALLNEIKHLWHEYHLNFTNSTKLPENCIPCTQPRLGNYVEKCQLLVHPSYIKSKLWKMMYFSIDNFLQLYSFCNQKSPKHGPAPSGTIWPSRKCMVTVSADTLQISWNSSMTDGDGNCKAQHPWLIQHSPLKSIGLVHNIIIDMI